MMSKKDKKMSLKYTFPKGHFGKLVMRLFPNNVGEADNHYEQNRGLIRVYIKEMFYDVAEVDFNFWILIYKGLF